MHLQTECVKYKTQNIKHRLKKGHEKIKYLTEYQQEYLLEILNIFEALFYGTLGLCKNITGRVLIKKICGSSMSEAIPCTKVTQRNIFKISGMYVNNNDTL